MKRFLLTLSVALACTAAWADSPLDYPSIWRCDTSKPNWYCDEDAQQPQRQVAPPAPAPQASASRPRASVCAKSRSTVAS